MVQYKSDIVDIELEPRLRREKAQAFFAGELDENDKEIWIWLPLSVIEIDDEVGGGTGNTVTVSMPESWALDKGLI